MAGPSRFAVISVTLIAVIYQFVLKTLLWDTLGYGRSITAISAFNARCEKIEGLGLEGCEDMWLHEPSGMLYMACSDSKSRTEWLPSLDYLNASARGLTDHMAIIDTRGSGSVGSRLQWLSPENFPGINGDATLNLHGFDVRVDPSSNTLRMLLINHRPPLDHLTNIHFDANSVGANSTIELFETKASSSTMYHVRTYVNKVIDTPNRVAWVDDYAFVFTNDHSKKTGLRRGLDTFIGGGNVGYCNDKGCHIAQDSGFNLPNGLVRGQDGLIYVPSSINGDIQVFSLTPNHHLEKATTIQLPYPIDNLSVDKNGDIFAATFPQTHIFLKSSKAPFEIDPPTSVFRIRKGGNDFGTLNTAGLETGKAILERGNVSYSTEKILEDDGSVLPGSTIAVHDAKTGRIYLGGAVAPYISICETR
jgi:hypothetical protein